MISSAALHTSCEAIEERVDMARIFNIQRYSLNDGQGIRTVVFFKGCPHYCPWCSNPESISKKIEIVKRESKCIHCNVCQMDPDKCPSTAMERIGHDISLDDLEKEVMKDEIFFRSSGGGVTLSGGEVLLQATFATRFLEKLRHQWGINTAIETAGNSSARRLLLLAQQCNQVLFDLKIMDEEQSLKILNLHLPRTLDNFRMLVQEGIKVIPRLPLIPGYTLSEDNVRKALDFLHPLGVKEIHLLPFHRYGGPKYTLLGHQWKMHDVKEPSDLEIDMIYSIVKKEGYDITIGG